MTYSSVVSKSNIQASQNKVAILFERANNLFRHISDATLDVSVCTVYRCIRLHKHTHSYVYQLHLLGFGIPHELFKQYSLIVAWEIILTEYRKCCDSNSLSLFGVFQKAVKSIWINYHAESMRVSMWIVFKLDLQLEDATIKKNTSLKSLSFIF